MMDHIRKHACKGFPSNGLLAAATLAAIGCGVQAASISYPNFANLSGLQLNGSAASPISNPVSTGDGSVLRLTDALWQSGSAFSTTSIPLQNQNSFSTYFSFRISHPLGSADPDGQGADGIVFVVQTVANNVGGQGGGIGYQGIANSVGIEFDTWNNGSWDDNNGNHVGIDLGGNIDSVVQTPIGTRMNDGSRWYSWVDYNGATDLLEVRLSQASVRPALATLSHTVDLVTALGSANAYVGFTSGTGSAGGFHDIIEWEFRDTYNPVSTPEAGPTLGLLGIALSGLIAMARKESAVARR